MPLRQEKVAPPYKRRLRRVLMHVLPPARALPFPIWSGPLSQQSDS